MSFHVDARGWSCHPTPARKYHHLRPKMQGGGRIRPLSWSTPFPEAESPTMPNAHLRWILDYLQRVVPPADQPGTDDAELLRQFASRGDQSAFELLVWRHGRMVLDVC